MDRQTPTTNGSSAHGRTRRGPAQGVAELWAEVLEALADLQLAGERR